MDKVKKKIIKSALSKVNATLKYYEADWISAKRLPELDQTRVSSFEEYVEIRVNYELSRIPELHDLVERLGGHLFICTSLECINETRHKFKTAHITFNNKSNFPEEDQDDVELIINQAIEWIGGREFTFNSVVERVKIVVIE